LELAPKLHQRFKTTGFEALFSKVFLKLLEGLFDIAQIEKLLEYQQLKTISGSNPHSTSIALARMGVSLVT
jgi:hypothetical protein